MSDLEWHDEEFTAAVMKIIAERLNKIGYRFMAIIDRLFTAPKHGRIYIKGTVSHQASAAGEAPAIDTGALRKSVAFEVAGGDDALALNIGPTDESGRAEVAEYLEFGTSKIEPRPAWRPAFELLTNEVESLLKVDANS
jgi:hypothetical protein